MDDLDPVRAVHVDPLSIHDTGPVGFASTSDSLQQEGFAVAAESFLPEHRPDVFLIIYRCCIALGNLDLER